MSIVSDLAFVAGVACLAVAGHHLHAGVAWAVVGVALVAFALGAAKKSSPQKGRK